MSSASSSTPDVWPMDPSRAFTLLVSQAVIIDDDQVAPAPPVASNQPQSIEKEAAKAFGLDEKQKGQQEQQPQQQQQPADEEVKEEVLTRSEKFEARVKGLSSLSQLPRDAQQGRRQVQLGQSVKLHLELSSVVENTTSCNLPPNEAFELADQVKIGAVRWEAQLAENKWVPAPKCCRTFPFFNERVYFVPTADVAGFALRAVAILADASTDRAILVKNNGERVGPSVIYSDVFVVVPTLQQRSIMEMAEQRQQIGVFTFEKLILEPLAESEGDDGMKILRSERGRKLLVACRKIVDGIQIRVCAVVGEEQQQQQEKLHEGQWTTAGQNSVSPCSLSADDEFTMTLCFSESAMADGEKTAVEIPLVFPSRHERDTAALGIRSLL